MVAAFRSNGGADKPMFLQVHLAYAPTDAEARAAAFDQWRQNTLGTASWPTCAPGADRRRRDARARRRTWTPRCASRRTRRHVEWLRRDFDRGFERLYLHEVGPEQERFIERSARGAAAAALIAGQFERSDVPLCDDGRRMTEDPG